MFIHRPTRLAHLSSCFFLFILSFFLTLSPLQAQLPGLGALLSSSKDTTAQKSLQTDISQNPEESYPEDRQMYRFQKASGVEYSLSSPYHAIKTHLDNLEPSNYRPSVSARALSASGMRSQEERISYAQKLRQIFLAKGIEINPDNISRNKNFTLKDSPIPNKYIISPLLPEIYLVKQNGRWMYSEHSIRQVDKIIEKLYPFNTYTLVELSQRLDRSGHTYLGLYLWQYIGLGALLLLGYIGWQLIYLLGTRIERFALGKLWKEPGSMPAAKLLAKAFASLALLILLRMVMPILQLPFGLWHFVLLLFRILVPLLITVLGYRLINVLSLRWAFHAKQTENTFDDQLVPLVRKIAKVLILSMGLLIVLHNFDVNITAILAGFSIGGLAVALAAQETLKNLFASLMIFLDRPFKVGDLIMADTIEGTVEEVGFRSTRVRTFNDSVVTVPNSQIADKAINNLGMRHVRRYFTMLSVTYDTPADLLEAFVEGVRDVLLSHPLVRKEDATVALYNFSASSLDLRINAYITVPTYEQEIRVRQELMLSMIRLAEALDVRFAFPTQTLHIEEFPEKQPITPMYQGNKALYMQRMRAFRQIPDDDHLDD